MSDVKVYQEADAKISESELGNELRLVNGIDLRHRLRLYHHAILYEQVDSKRMVQFDAVVLKRH